MKGGEAQANLEINTAIFRGPGAYPPPPQKIFEINTFQIAI